VKPTVIHTHNSFHLGDNLINLHFLRDAALRNPTHMFIHHIEPCHLEQLAAVVFDIPNLELGVFDERPESSMDFWRNAGDVWNRHPLRNNLIEYHLWAFRDLAEKWNIKSRFREPCDWRAMLFDYHEIIEQTHTSLDDEEFDILFNNAQPCSGQFLPYDNLDYFDELIDALSKKHRVLVTQPSKTGVPCTRDFGNVDITGIGHLSITIPYIMGIPNGPMWPTFNVWNVDTVQLRMIFLANGETINLSHPSTTCHVKSLDEAWKALKERQLL